MNTIEFNSRYGEPRIMTKISDNTYTVRGKSRFTRGSDEMVDFEGGPYIQTGMTPSNLGFVGDNRPITNVLFIEDSEEGSATVLITVKE